MKDQKLEAVETVLKSPVAAGLSEQAEKVRRNLLVFSLVSVAAVLWEVKLSPNGSIFGFTFEGLTQPKILLGLALVTGFSLIHFCWLGWDSMMEWRLRITGTRLALVTVGKGASDDGDYPDDPRQSTLHNWWATLAPHLGNLSKDVATLQEELNKIRVLVQGDPQAEEGNVLAQLNRLTSGVGQLGVQVVRAQETLLSPRMAVSLKRFDTWYLLFLRSQNLRWLVLDVGIPILFASFALWLLAKEICKS